MKKHLLLCLALAATTLSSQAQTAVSLAGSAPDASAMFDVSATDKGMLIPRVALSSTASSSPITPAPLTSLLVYNTAGTGDVTPGYYYWNGTSWTRLLNGASNLSGAGTTNYLARWTPNGSTLGIGVAYDNGTNVGIGTTGPNFKMDVQQDITMSGDINPGTSQLSVGGTSTVGKRMLMGYDINGNGFGFIKAGNYGVSWTPLSLQPNGGNVGIGNTGPAVKLHVTGNAFFDLPAGGGALENSLTIKKNGQGQVNFGSYPGNWTPALQIQNNDNSRYVWLSPLDNASGGLARIVTGGSDFAIYPQNVLASTFSSSGDVTTARYHFAQYFNSTDNSVASNVSGVMIKEAGQGNYLRTGTAAAVSAFLNSTIAPTYANLTGIPTRTAWSGVHRNFVAEQLSWKNYGNGHTIFDASQGTSPDGGAVNNTNAQIAWSATYPTLMGWNGANTYGVRVDMARYAESAGSAPGDNLGNHSATTTLAMNANRISNARGMEIYTGDGSGWGDNAYAIFREDGVWNFPYPDLRIAYHTGIKLGANSSYNGIRFYNDYNMATQTMSVGDGDNNVRIYYDLRVPFIYDMNDYGYYMDPNSYSNMYMVNRQRGFNSTEYDYNNTAYYMDLNNTSNVYALYRYYGFNGREYDGNNGGYYVDPDGYTNLWQLQTNNITYTSYGGDQTYVGWGWAYNYGYYCTYSCGWWNYSSCGTTCYDYYNKMQVNGRAYSYSWANFSDGRLKTNIGTISNALDMVTAMRGVTYDWKTNEATRAEAIKNADPVYISEPDKKAEKLQSQVGFIAQEIQNILPSAVSQIEEKDSTGAIIGTTLGVDYTSVIPVLVEAIKELKKELDEMKTAMAMNTNTTPVQQTIYNAPPTGANSMSAGKTNSTNLSVKDAVKLLEDNLSFMTKEHQEQMKDFIKEIKSSDKLTPDQLSKVLEFRNNIKEFQKNK